MNLLQKKTWYSLGALFVAISVFVLSGCNSIPEISGSSAIGELATAGDYHVVYEEDDDLAFTTETEDCALITLSGQSASASGAGVLCEESSVVISLPGTYRVTGTLLAGQLRVNCPDGRVTLLLSGASLRSFDGPALYVQAAEKVILYTEAGTKNILEDSSVHTPEENDDLNAALFCRCDLTLNGNGTLIVKGNYNNGINCKDNLKITSGTLSVTAVGNGIKGKDSVAIRAGAVTVTAGKDGIKSTKTEDSQKGFVLIEGGTVVVTAQEDGIQAETGVTVQDGSVSVYSGDGSDIASSSANRKTSGDWENWNPSSSSEENSSKGIKAATNLSIRGGTVTIDASDDSLHSNGDLLIEGGILHLSSGDDGIHADNALTVSGGKIDIIRAYEGLEALSLTVSSGQIRVTAFDDGLNAAGGNDQSSLRGRPGQNAFSSASAGTITICGGYLYINAEGDGIDSNGSLTITDGTVIVDGPASSGNGALDYSQSCTISGGFLLAVGAAGMDQTPGTDSLQNSILFRISTLSSGTTICLIDGNGVQIFCFTPAENISRVLISSPLIQKEASYTLSVGGTCNGTQTDGLYIDGTYQGGTTLATVTVSSSVTIFGGSFGFGGGFNPGPGKGIRPGR